MFSRFIPQASRFRLLSLVNLKTKPCYGSHFRPSLQNPNFSSLLRHFSTNNENGGKDSVSDKWTISRENETKFDQFFSEESGNIAGLSEADSGVDSSIGEGESWLKENESAAESKDIFQEIDKEMVGQSGSRAEDDEWPTADGFKPWSLEVEEKSDVFDLGEADAASFSDEMRGESGKLESEKIEEQKKLEAEEKALTAIVKGPNRAFGDLIAASGITDAMLDSLIALKDFDGIEGLPPLRDIEDMRYDKNTRKSTRAEIERLKQEEIAKARVRQVDHKGRAYGTGRRKCSVARVWVQPGDGKFIVNDKQFDVYFPMLDHRAALLRPFSETKTLGLWDVNCTVKGGGVSGQVGAIRLGISRALQNWEPDLRPALRSAGFLTRDSRAVERKKPGKAKARKSYQWVKR